MKLKVEKYKGLDIGPLSKNIGKYFNSLQNMKLT